MKKIDKLLVQNFIGPFVVAFMIALFVLTMQYLWVHIDDIMGRGVGFFRLIEIVGYLSVSLFPMALPLGVLISSVMVMGNLSERYELTSMKSAGIPLVRIMAPLALICSFIAVFSFLSSNYIIPFTNLQFKSRLHDVRNQKPTLNLKEGLFNYDFKGFVIYIGKKDKNGRDLEDIIIYDENNSTSQGLSVTTAARGEMYTVQDGRYFIMDLYDGARNQETNKRYVGKDKNFPFVRTKFKKHHMVFDLSQFDKKETDQELFKSHQSMKSVEELLVAIDSLDSKLDSRYLQLHKNLYRNFYQEMRKDTVNFKPKEPVSKSSVGKKDASAIANKMEAKQDSVSVMKELVTTRDSKINTKPISTRTDVEQAKAAAIAKEKLKKSVNRLKLNQEVDQDIKLYPNMLETFKLNDRAQIIAKARNAARSIHSMASSSFRTLDSEKEKKVKHIYIMHTKFTNAVICLLFLFIGGPMGAIIRKGGFGMPLLISIGFFVSFIFLNLLFEKLAESFVLPAVLAAWMPIFILVPVAVLLTYQAMSDKQIISFAWTSNILDRMRGRYKWATVLFGGQTN